MPYLDKNVERTEKATDAKKKRKRFTFFSVIVLLFIGGLTLLAIVKQNKALKKENALHHIQKPERSVIKKGVDARKNDKPDEEKQKKAIIQKIEAERQKKITDIRAIQSSLRRSRIQLTKLSAKQSEKKAVLEKTISQDKNREADSLKKLTLFEKKSAESTLLFDNAKTLALKSLNYTKHNEDNNLKALLALWAYKLNLTNKNDTFDPDIILALSEADRAFENSDKYILKDHTDEVRGLAVSPNGKYLASVGADGRVILWDLQNPYPTPKVLISGNKFDAVAFSSDNKWLAACSEQKIYKWNLEGPTQKPDILSEHTAKITSLVFTNTQIVSGGSDKLLSAYNMAGNIVLKDSFDSRIKSLAFSSAQNIIGVGCEDGSIYLIRQNGKAQKPELLVKPLKQGSSITGLSFNDKGNVLAAAYSNGTLNVYYTNLHLNRLSGKKIVLAKTLSRRKYALSAIAFGRGDLLAGAGHDGKVKLWQWTTDVPPVVFGQHGKRLESIAIGANGKNIYSGCKDKNIYIYDIDQQDIVNRLQKKITRNLTPYEWNYFMGNMPYQKLINNLQ